MDQFAALNCSLQPCTLSTSNALWKTLKAHWWEKPHFLGFVLIRDLLFPKNSTFGDPSQCILLSDLQQRNCILRKPKSEHTFGEYPLLPPHGAGNFFAKKGWFLVMVLRGSKTSGYSLENTGISCLLVEIYTQSSSWLPRLNNSPSNSSVGRRIKNSAGKNQSFGVKYPIVASFPFIPKWRKIDVQRPQYPEWINPQLTESWSRDSYP